MSEKSKKISLRTFAFMGFSALWGFGNVLNGFVYFNGIGRTFSYRNGTFGTSDIQSDGVFHSDLILCFLFCNFQFHFLQIFIRRRRTYIYAEGSGFRIPLSVYTPALEHRRCNMETYLPAFSCLQRYAAESLEFFDRSGERSIIITNI